MAGACTQFINNRLIVTDQILIDTGANVSVLEYNNKSVKTSNLSLSHI